MAPQRSNDRPEPPGSTDKTPTEEARFFVEEQKNKMNTITISRKRRSTRKSPDLIPAFQRWFRRYGIPHAFHASSYEPPIPSTLHGYNVTNSLQSGTTSACTASSVGPCTARTVATEGSLVPASDPIDELEGIPSNTIVSTTVPKRTAWFVDLMALVWYSH